MLEQKPVEAINPAQAEIQTPPSDIAAGIGSMATAEATLPPAPELEQLRRGLRGRDEAVKFIGNTETMQKATTLTMNYLIVYFPTFLVKHSEMNTGKKSVEDGVPQKLLLNTENYEKSIRSLWRLALTLVL